MKGMIDSHAHICGKELFPGWREITAKAKEAGIERIMIVCRNVEEVKRALELAANDSMFDVASGLYPNDILRMPYEEWGQLMELAGDPRVKAVGEIGMDYSFYETVVPKVLQKEVFVRQMELANKVKKPVIIHMRNATEDTRRYIKGHLKVPGIIHGYSGGYKAMKDFLDMGIYISFSPAAILESEHEDTGKVAGEVPLDRILVESNAPFKAPTSMTGTVHGPETVAGVMDYICRVRGIKKETLVEAVYDNYRGLFS
ncbi:MAG: TatD family hydrolase [Hungatella sp.]|nr:TatD family hydrolase [Hungatella sp.]